MGLLNQKSIITSLSLSHDGSRTSDGRSSPVSTVSKLEIRMRGLTRSFGSNWPTSPPSSLPLSLAKSTCATGRPPNPKSKRRSYERRREGSRLSAGHHRPDDRRWLEGRRPSPRPGRNTNSSTRAIPRKPSSTSSPVSSVRPTLRHPRRTFAPLAPWACCATSFATSQPLSSSASSNPSTA